MAWSSDYSTTSPPAHTAKHLQSAPRYSQRQKTFKLHHLSGPSLSMPKLTCHQRVNATANRRLARRSNPISTPTLPPQQAVSSRTAHLAHEAASQNFASTKRPRSCVETVNALSLAKRTMGLKKASHGVQLQCANYPKGMLARDLVRW